ncbi:hypothetical protein [Pseudomonas paralcaligenes]|uniref:hypothetical protein n=1 Tax=Pseudomonas paralcaligenes TaxID=2772558 RepID=UPI001C8117B5|nr:hypothetical protein [Pseudomonas paralcaligenes]
MLEQYAAWVGWGVMAAGGFLLMGLLLIAGIAVVNHFGRALWEKLLALYDLHTLRAHLRMLEAQGKTLRKPEGSDDD